MRSVSCAAVFLLMTLSLASLAAAQTKGETRTLTINATDIEISGRIAGIDGSADAINGACGSAPCEAGTPVKLQIHSFPAGDCAEARQPFHPISVQVGDRFWTNVGRQPLLTSVLVMPGILNVGGTIYSATTLPALSVAFGLLGAGLFESCQVPESFGPLSALEDLRFQLRGTTERGGAYQLAVKVDDIRPAAVCTPRTLSITSISSVTGDSLSFQGGQRYPFDPSISRTPGRHLAIFYKDVVDDAWPAGPAIPGAFAVKDFTVSLVADVACLERATNPEWTLVEAPPAAAGQLVVISPAQAELRNPKRGGVYKITYRPTPNAQRSEVNIVLPLAGADVTRQIVEDITLADKSAELYKGWSIYSVSATMLGADPLKDAFMRWTGLTAAENIGTGNYVGRPNNQHSPTVRLYNEVADDNGQGAVASWKGIPIRVAKLSNFIWGYTFQKLEASEAEHQIAQAYGTANDRSANRSWSLGRVVANAPWILRSESAKTNAEQQPVLEDATRTLLEDSLVENVLKDIFIEQYRMDPNEKALKLWPNPQELDNFVESNKFTDVNVQFTRPGFLGAKPVP